MHLDIKDIISNNIMIFSKATTMYIALQIKLVLAVSRFNYKKLERFFKILHEQ